MATTIPASFKAWQYRGTKGGLEKNLKLNTVKPPADPKPDHHQIQIIASSLNPVDVKGAENPILRRLMIPSIATPGLDYAGRIITPAKGSSLKAGQLVFGVAGASPFAGGALSEYAFIKPEGAIPLPDGVDVIDVATIGVAGLTAYQSIGNRVKAGDKVFINGGSGGCGVFGIQIAKAKGCYVCTSCSSRNVELCKSLGADRVVDYTKQNVVEALRGENFDHVVDNVGNDMSLYWKAHEYTRPGAAYIQVAGELSLHSISNGMKVKLWPGFLGGGQRKREGILAQLRYGELKQIGDWMKEKKVKAVVDSRFTFEEAPKAFEKLKTGRARGKIVVEVAGAA